MNKIVFIFSCYMLLFALVPCADGAVYADDINTNIHTEKDTQHPPHDDTHQDDCTYLCTCTCCGHLVSLQDIPEFQMAIEPEITELKIFFKQASLQDYLLTFWQPPKIYIS